MTSTRQSACGPRWVAACDPANSPRMCWRCTGATRLPPAIDPAGTLGRVGDRLVVVHTQARPPGTAGLRRALRLAENAGGGWKKLVVLVWNTSPGLADAITALGQGDRLAVEIIPPEFADGGGAKRRRPMPAAGHGTTLATTRGSRLDGSGAA